ncbi:MAG TPA: tetratricopeptide repeat protein, partial [Caulobacteraceae bacterium]
MPAKSAKASARAATSAAALGFPAAPVPADDNGASSPAGLKRLETAIAELRALSVMPMLRRAIDALRAEDVKAGCDWALKALNQDANSGMAWYVLAVAREKAGDFANSLKAYQAAVQLLPEESDVANDLGRLAYRMGMKDVAEQLFRRYFAAHPGSLDAANNLAGALRDLGRGDEAIDILKPAIRSDPTTPPLWNTLGTILAERGDPASALTFFDEAVRLDPGFGRARYNRGNAHLSLGDLEAALADCEGAYASAVTPDDKAMMRLARSTIKIGLGRIGEGWDDYEARLDPHFAGGTMFLTRAAPWRPETPLAGKTLLVMGEQGLGDEVLFANMLPDVLEALGPDGRLVIAVEPRLVSLFQRSFPRAEVVAHSTYAAAGRIYRGAVAIDGRDDIDLWVPMASLLRRFRRGLSDFPDRKAFLTPDPARVAHWRAELAKAPAGRKVGILWKSM